MAALSWRSRYQTEKRFRLSARRIRNQDWKNIGSIFLAYELLARSTEIVANVAGQCVIHMSRDGKMRSRVDCDATDERAHAYRLHFQGDGAPVSATYPQGRR